MDASKTLLSLDLSTTCTGYSVFDIETHALITYGKLKPSTKGISKLTYPKQQLTKMVDLANQIYSVIQNYKPTVIVIEEIAGSKNRLGQKVLDGAHFILAWTIEDYLPIVHYFDVTGNQGWRTYLQLRLSDADKAANKEAKILNRKLSSSQQIPIIGPKHLACRYVNVKFDTCFNVDLCKTDADVCDSIAMGHAFLLFRLAKASK